MRIKSQWFKQDKPKSARQSASAMAFIIWRVAQNALKQMRASQFDIDPGPQYFAFMSEFLVFLVNIADRLAYARLDAAQRAEFTTALAIRVAEILEDNANDLLGPAAQQSHQRNFVALFNALADDYAAFAFDDAGADFAFLRYLGNRVLELMPKKDQSWVIDQIMAIEAPEAISTVRRGMDGLYPTGPRAPSARRAGAMGE
jgi:hypothetical protein